MIFQILPDNFHRRVCSNKCLALNRVNGKNKIISTQNSIFVLLLSYDNLCRKGINTIQDVDQKNTRVGHLCSLSLFSPHFPSYLTMTFPAIRLISFLNDSGAITMTRSP